MDRFIAQDIPEQQREQIIADSCDAIESIGYTRRFSPEELAQKREELASVAISLAEIEEEKKDAMADFKERMKPLDEDRKRLLQELKSKTEFVNETCYKQIYHDERMVGYYNRLGELVSSRPIMPQEMQKTTFSINRKTGTNDE